MMSTNGARVRGESYLMMDVVVLVTIIKLRYYKDLGSRLV